MRRNRYGKPRGRKWRIVLEPAEREFLRAERRRSHCEGIRKRIAVVLEANEARGRKVRTNAEVAAGAGVSEATVTNVCRDYCEGGLARLLKYGRGGGSDTARLRATGDVEAAIIAKACSPAPEGRSRWTLTLLEQEMTVVLEDGWSPSRATIGRVLSRNELRPHMREYWCAPPVGDADFVAFMEDVLDLYQLPHDPRFPVWCMDEKPYQLLGCARPTLLAIPGSDQKVDDEYLRDGTACVFVFLRPHTGDIFHSVQPTRTAVDWANQVKYLVDVVEPDAERIILICDNLNTHCIGSLYKAFGAAEAHRIARRIEIHHTPKHGSWLDAAEIAINMITRECLDRRIESIGELESELRAWQERYDAEPTPVDWQFTTADARVKLKRLYPDFERNVRANEEKRARKLERLEELRQAALRRRAAASGGGAQEPPERDAGATDLPMEAPTPPVPTPNDGIARRGDRAAPTDGAQPPKSTRDDEAA